MSNEKRHIFLIGHSGVGKTTVGQAVAKLLGLPFADLDDVITEKINEPIGKYITSQGEPAFRQIEREAVRDLSIDHSPHVYAAGGGTVLDTRNVIDMRNNGYVVFLDAFEADVLERLKNDPKTSNRALLKGNLEEKVHELYLTRRECYELASDITIATSRRDIETVAEAVVRQYSNMSGQTSDSANNIIVGANILGNASKYIPEYSSIVLVSQETVPKQFRNDVLNSLNASGVKVLECLVPDGEVAKSFEGFQSVIAKMAENKTLRTSAVVAIGGGVVGDLSGFVAATYHRGIDVIQVPTTLLAQVDSSIGGKCGINLEAGKNLVGAFHQPKAIIADTSTLKTLPESDFTSGLGEVVKYALLGNTAVAQAIKDHSKEILERDPEVLVPVIRSCMNHKVQVVARDPFERNGIRATLNLGHTLGHAIEKLTGYSIPHGVAVAIGLRFILQLSCDLGRIPGSQLEESVELLDLLGLESKIPNEAANVDSLINVMYSDKKSLGNISMILCKIGGSAELVHDVDVEAVRSTLAKYINNTQ